MTNDTTENIRREMVDIINTNPPNERAAAEAKYGQVWTTDEASAEFEILGFMAPFVVVKRKSDNVKGSLMFQHSPRFYFNFKAN
jgi:hypothetical protein